MLQQGIYYLKTVDLKKIKDFMILKSLQGSYDLQIIEDENEMQINILKKEGEDYYLEMYKIQRI